MKVALFGATGFVGSYIVDELLNGGHKPVVLIRESSDEKLSQLSKCKVIKGDIDDVDAINNTIKSADAVIYCIGIIREFPNKGITFNNLHFQGAKRCMDSAIKLGVNRFILMSANGVKIDGTGYQKTKHLAEQYLKYTELNWTIFRPSLIFGNPRGNNRPEFCTQLKKDMLGLPIPAPNFHKGLNPLDAGKFAMSPINVKDVASFFVKSIDMEASFKKTYHLGGVAYYWKDIIQTIAKAYGKNKWTIPAPAIAIQIVASLLGRFSWFPISKDQLTMLVEGNVCESYKTFELFKIEPTPFNTETLNYLNN